MIFLFLGDGFVQKWWRFSLHDRPLGCSRDSTSGVDLSPHRVSAAIMLQAARQSDDCPGLAGDSHCANASLFPHHRRTARNRKSNYFQKSRRLGASRIRIFTGAPGNDRHAGTVGHLSVGDFGHGGPATGSVGVLPTTLFGASAGSIWLGHDRPFAF